MQEMETDLEALKEKLMQIYDAKLENRGNEVIIKKRRIIDITVDSHCFTCMLDHDILFVNAPRDGTAVFNKAEIFLLPEEYPAFFSALLTHQIPLPPRYHQWQRVNPHIISVCLESVESAENFAHRLSAALQAIELISCQLKQ